MSKQPPAPPNDQERSAAGPAGVDVWAPVAVPPEPIHWRGSLPFLAMHAGLVAIIWVGVSPVAVAIALTLYLLRMFAITAFYHRYFSHRELQRASDWASSR